MCKTIFRMAEVLFCLFASLIATISHVNEGQVNVGFVWLRPHTVSDICVVAVLVVLGLFALVWLFSFFFC